MMNVKGKCTVVTVLN